MAAATDSPDRRHRWLLPTIGALLAIGIAIAWPTTDGGTPTPTEQPAAASDRDDAAAKVDAETGALTVSSEAALPLERTEIARTEAAQGLRGRVVTTDGRAAAGVAVHLLESTGNDPLQAVLLQHVHAPVQSDVTGADGSFTLDLPFAQDKVYELLVVASDHATLRRAGLRLSPGTFYDLGDLELRAGTTLTGRVSVAGHPGLPVPGAIVRLLPRGSFADAALLHLPDDGSVHEARVDAQGEYELRHAPTRGTFSVSAWAPGFARVVQRDVTIDPDAPKPLDFELPPGQMLPGQVRTSTGAPIADARIEAWPKRPGQPPLFARSDAEGHFVVEGLGSGTHDLRVTARGFLAAARDAVATTDAPVLFELQPEHRLRVLARTPAGTVLRRYQLLVRRFFPRDPGTAIGQLTALDGELGALVGVPRQQVELSFDDEYANVTGIPDGTFLVEITAEGYAPSRSQPFRFEPAATAGPTEVVVTLHRGCHLRGQVVDAAGRPLAGATVTSQQDGMFVDSPLLRVLRDRVPTRTTTSRTTTDATGRFSLPRLSLGTYQLMVEHPDACRTFVRGIDGTLPGERMLPPVRLLSGSLVTGTARLANGFAPQVKVILSTPDDAPADRSIRLETVTDGEGRFRFDRRIPPGNYVLRGAAVGSAAPEAEIFQQMLQLRRSSTTFSVPEGQDEVVQDLLVRSAN